MPSLCPLFKRKSVCLTVRRSGLPLEFQVRLADLIEAELYGSALGGLQSDDVAFDAGQLTHPGGLVFDGFAQNNFRLLPQKPLEVSGLRELAFDTRRADFEEVGT